MSQPSSFSAMFSPLKSLCAAIRAGTIGRREAQRAHRLSGNLIHQWLDQFDRGQFDPTEKPAARVAEEYELRIAELERKVGQLTMEADLLKKRTSAITRAATTTSSSSAAHGLFHSKGLPSDRPCP